MDRMAQGSGEVAEYFQGGQLQNSWTNTAILDNFLEDFQRFQKEKSSLARPELPRNPFLPIACKQTSIHWWIL